MRITRVVTLGATVCCLALAQSERPEVDWAAISQKLDVLQVAVQTRNLVKTEKGVDDLRSVVFTEWHKQQPSPAESLARAEREIAAHPIARAMLVAHLAHTALDAGELEKAEQYAREALQIPPQRDMDYSFHGGNIVLGLLALKRGDIVAAKTYLLDSTKTKGNPSLKKWGPNLALAKELLDKGENDVVLEYLQSSKRFVTENPKLDIWIATLKGGHAPDWSHEYLWHQ